MNQPSPDRVSCRRARSWTAGAGFALRLAWIALVALHVLPLVRLTGGVVSGDGGWAALLGLGLVQAFFILKAADVRWLRWRGARGSLIALIILALIGHGDVAAKGIEQVPMLAPAATLVLTAASARWVLRRRRMLVRSGNAFAARLRLQVNHLAGSMIALLTSRRRPPIAVRYLAGRAPPF